VSLFSNVFILDHVKQLQFNVLAGLLLALPVITNAQETKFQNYYGASSTIETGKGLAIRSDNSMLLAGESGTNQPDNDDLMLKLVNSAGDEQWTKYYGGALDEVFNAIVTNASDEVFIGGHARPALRDNADAVVYKINAAGDQLWSKTFNYLNQDVVSGLAATSDGGCFVAINGNWNGYDAPTTRIVRLSNTGEELFTSTLLPNDIIEGIDRIGSDDVVAIITGGATPRLMRFSGVDGQTIWAKPFTTPDVTLNSVAVNQATEAIVAVALGDGAEHKVLLYNDLGVLQQQVTLSINILSPNNSSVSFTSSNEVYVVIERTVTKYDQSMNQLQTANLTSSLTGTAYQGAVNNEGELHVVGTGFNTDSGSDPYIATITSTLGVESTKRYGNGLPFTNESAYSAVMAPGGGYVFVYDHYFAGKGSDIIVTKLSPNGSVVWETQIGGANREFGRSIAATPDGGFIIGGYLASSNIVHYLAKIDANGILLWEKTHNLGSISSTLSARVVPHPAGGYMGVATGSLTSSTSQRRPLLLRFSETGDTLWTKKFGSSTSSAFRNLSISSDGNIYAVGTKFEPPFNFGWWLKLDTDGNILSEEQLVADISILYDIHERPNGNILVAGIFDEYVPTLGDSIILREYDSLGNTVVTNYIADGSNHFWTYLEPSPDGNLLLFANKFVSLANGERVDSLVVTKFEPDFSSVNWSRSYGVGGDLVPFFGMSTPDGGGISVGQARRTNTSDAFIYKVDDQGISSQINLSAASRSHLQVSPNPSAGPMNVMLKSPINGAAILRLFGPDARLIWEENIIKDGETWQSNHDFNTLAPGTYFLQIEMDQVKVGTTWLKM
jgi:hypothetical protein